MKAFIKTGMIICGLFATFAFTTPAHADPDPHIPNPVMGYCPGGGAGSLYIGYCDGTPYPDGSYWHHINYGMPWMGTTPGAPDSPLTSCVVSGDGGPLPPAAPPGGCGGAVQ